MVSRLAYLIWIRNVRQGLVTRTRIIRALEQEGPLTISELSKIVGLTTSTIAHHIANMKREHIVVALPTSPVRWRLSPPESEPLTSFLVPQRKRRKRKKH